MRYLVLCVVLFAATVLVGCGKESDADKYVDQQLQVAKEQGVQVTPGQEQQLRDMARRGEEADRQHLKEQQQDEMRRGKYVKDPIK